MTGLWSACLSFRRLQPPPAPERHNTPISPSLPPWQAFLRPKTNTLRLTAMLAVPGHRVVMGFPGSSSKGWSPDVSNGSLEEPFAEVTALGLQQE